MSSLKEAIVKGIGDLGMQTATGIVSGVALSGLGYASVKYILPNIRKIFWQGIDLTGRWTEQYEELTTPKSAQNRKITIDLVQKACELSGQASAIDVENTKIRLGLSTFYIVGKVNQRFVHFTMISTDKSNYGVAQYLLDIDPNGNILTGVTSYWDRAENALASATCKLIKEAI